MSEIFTAKLRKVKFAKVRKVLNHCLFSLRNLSGLCGKINLFRQPYFNLCEIFVS